MSQIWKHLHVEYLLFLSDFNETWIFSIDFQKKLKYPVSSKSVQWETDEHEEAFHNFADTPKKDHKMEKVVSQWLITQDTDFCQQAIQKCGKDYVEK
jgi:hypothetical protein